MGEPTIADIHQLGAALAKAITQKGAWPLRLEIMNLKHEIVGFSPENVEVFRISIPGSWL